MQRIPGVTKWDERICTRRPLLSFRLLIDCARHGSFDGHAALELFDHRPQPLQLTGELLRQLRGTPKRLFLPSKDFRKTLRGCRGNLLERCLSVHGFE